jgi:RND family efflux transporter MFP subunit
MHTTPSNYSVFSLPAALAVLLICTAPATIAADASASASAKAAARPVLTVTTAKPQQQNAALKIAANGNVQAWQEAVIGAEANGLRVAEILVNVGDQVRKGQLLATLSAAMIQAELAQAQAAQAEAQAAWQDAHANADRARALSNSGAYSQQQTEQYLTQEMTAKARLQAATAAVQLQQTRLNQTRIVAPDNGVISARMSSVGAVVGAGSDLFKLVRQGRLEWRAELTGQELTRVQAGMEVQITAPSGELVKAKVRSVAPTVDLQTRNGLAYVDIPAGSAGGLKAGMFARGELILGHSNALSVPQLAVVLRDGYSYVFRLNADQRVTLIKVQTGRRFKTAAGEQVEILSGLAADATVVTQGAGFLNDGDLVRVAATPAPAAPVTAPAAR